MTNSPPPRLIPLRGYVKNQPVYVRCRYVRKTTGNDGLGDCELEALDRYGRPTGQYLYTDTTTLLTPEDARRQ